MTRKLLVAIMFTVACSATLYVASPAEAVDEAPPPREVGEKKPDAKGKFGKFDPEKLKALKEKFAGKFDLEKLKALKGKFDPEKLKQLKGKFGKGFPGKDGKKKEDDKEE